MRRFVRRFSSSFSGGSRFDETIERRWTGSLKFDRYAVDRNDKNSMRYKDVLPMWVADMDFRAPDVILRKLSSRLEHGIFGYTAPEYSVKDPILKYLRESHGLNDVEARHLVFLPGLVVGLNLLARLAKSRDEAMMTAVPVYPPFLTCARNWDTPCITTPLKFDETRSRFTFDFENMELAVQESPKRVGVFLLCNPHNPVGRCFDETELARLGEFAVRHDLIVCSDEIHCELVLPGHRHVPFLGAFHGKDQQRNLTERTILFHAPSKTFNLAGFSAAFAAIPATKLRSDFKKVMPGITADINTFGYTVLRAAYEDENGECTEFREELVRYIDGNVHYFQEEVKKRFHPWIKFQHSQEATYLVWLDARELGGKVGRSDVSQLLEEEAGVGLNNGAMFGPGEHFAGFVRINLACPRSTIEQALERIQQFLALL